MGTWGQASAHLRGRPGCLLKPSGEHLARTRGRDAGGRPAALNTNVDAACAAEASRAGLWEQDGAQGFGKGNVGCAKSTRPHPEVWQRVTWRQKSRWGSSSPCVATRNSGPFPGHFPFPAALTLQPFPRPGLPDNKQNYPKCLSGKGQFPKYLPTNWHRWLPVSPQIREYLLRKWNENKGWGSLVFKNNVPLSTQRRSLGG